MSMHEPMVSVIIPTYRRPEQICTALECVFEQTYSNIEIIVVDDNGENEDYQIRTAEAIEKYKDKIRYIVHKFNKGGSAARNTGWKTSSGKYLMFLDDDDYIDKRKIASQVEALEQMDETWGACYTAYHVVLPDGKIQKSGTKKSGNLYIQALMRTLYICGGSNLLVRRSAVDELDGYDETFRRNQDIEFLARLCERYNILYVDKDYLEVRMGDVPQNKRCTINLYEEVTEFYLLKFERRIASLDTKDSKRVMQVISIERARVALQHREYKRALNHIVKNKVNVIVIFKYIGYIFRRMITRETYGFFI